MGGSDEKGTFKRGKTKRSFFLALVQRSSQGEARETLPQVKRLKKLKAAGSAAKKPAKKFEFLVQWHLTERCNLRCAHCYQSNSLKPELSFSQIICGIDEVLSTLSSWTHTYNLEFFPSFNVTGGEPFLSPALFPILEYLERKNCTFFILSNGTLIDPGISDSLARLSCLKGVQISIEGTEDVHDKIRGKGAFESAVRGLRNLTGRGIEVTINVTLSRLNAHALPDLMELAAELRVKRLGFSRLVPQGAGKSLLKGMMSASEVRDIYKKFSLIQHEKVELASGDPLAVQVKDDIESDLGPVPVGGCAAGVSGITVLSDGTLTPCRRLGLPLGNILQDSFREVWSTSEILTQLRNKASYSGKCGKCYRWANCRGCRAVSYWNSVNLNKPNLFADDPQCFFPGIP